MANLIRPFVTASSQSSASVTLRLIDPTRLIDPATSKKIWESALGLTMTQIIAMILIMFYKEYREDLREINSEKLTSRLQKEIEEFFVAPKEKPQPTPEPTPTAMGD